MTTDAAELDFLGRVSPSFDGVAYSLPLPALPPQERLKRRLAFRNQIYVYPRESALSGQKLISIFCPETPFGVITPEEFFGDATNPLELGQAFDPHTPVFSQILALRDAVPHMARSALLNENCDFASNLSSSKNCYLVFNSTYAEDCMYGENLWRTRDSIDCSHLSGCELCYDCLLCDNCYNLQSSWDCEGCSDSFYLLGCTSCRNCFGCANLRHKEHCIYNRPVSQKEFDDFIRTLNLGSRRARVQAAAESENVWRLFPRPHVTVKHCENAVGNYLFHSRSLDDCFFIRDGESLVHCAFLYGGAKDCRDFTFVGLNCELMYECAWCALNCRLLRFCFWCLQSEDLLYCWHCIGCRSCFGCVGLRNKEFCVLNKQYSREEYRKLLPVLIRHMEKTGEWGEFFPAAISPIPYNHSMAQRFFPLDKEEASQHGCSWYDKPLISVAGALPAAEIPDCLPAGDEPLVFVSELSGTPFRITAEERKRYELFNAPPPSTAYDERLTARALRLGGLALYRRICPKTGKEIVTNWRPESGWIIWEQEAYEAATV